MKLIFDLEDRTKRFATDTLALCRTIRTTVVEYEIVRQLSRASGSVAANYIEANEAISKKDFLLHMKIARKEAKESRLWLTLLQCPDGASIDRDRLVKESTELLKILSSIINKIDASP